MLSTLKPLAAIVVAIADGDPTYCDDYGRDRCCFCSADRPTNDDKTTHDKDCAWRLAKEYKDLLKGQSGGETAPL